MKRTQPEIWDISVVDSATASGPGSSGSRLHRVRDISTGDSVNESDLAMNLHAGTEGAPARALLMDPSLKDVAV